MQMLFTGEKVEQVSVELPQGEKLQLDITDIQRKYTDRELPDMVSCAVKKTAEMIRISRMEYWFTVR
mgnify:FL=1